MKTTLFDDYVMVDWSAASRPVTDADSIWVCHVDRDRHVRLENPPTRAAARALLTGLLVDAVAAGRRVLVGYDFPFGYPAGFAAALAGGAGDGEAPAWRRTWDELARRVADGTHNENNRFAVATALNALVGDGPGPFWGCPPSAASARLPAARRGQFTFPVPTGTTTLAEYRLVERRLRAAGRLAHSPWKLYTAGSVGSQALLGIPVVAALRDHARLHACSLVWPFETGVGWAGAASRRPLVVHAEIWPSLWPADAQHRVKDAAQVLTAARRCAQLDDDAGLLDALRPAHLTADERAAVETEEGWVLAAP
jgi:precorrin-8X/cobalt-precorrin-8 methylmutase